MQIENGVLRGHSPTAVGYEVLSLTDASGLFFAVLGGYAIAAVSLVAEYCCSKWSGRARVHIATIDNRAAAHDCAWLVAEADTWLLVSGRNGARFALTSWLQLRMSDASYQELLAALPSVAEQVTTVYLC